MRLVINTKEQWAYLYLNEDTVTEGEELSPEIVADYNENHELSGLDISGLIEVEYAED